MAGLNHSRERDRRVRQVAQSLEAAFAVSGGEVEEAGSNDQSRQRLLEKLAPRFPELGITRVGDLTGLDTIGVPVWFACRPNSRALSVCQGKGLTDRAAQVGAIMEAVEDAIAERPDRCVTEIGSLRDMACAGHRVIPFDAVLRCSQRAVDPDRRRAWVPGFSLLSGDLVYAPYELVGMDLRSATPWDRDAFQMSSIGLAAGSTFRSAALHALSELIEHSATTTLDVFGFHAAGAWRLELARGVHPPLDALRDRLASADVEATLVSLNNAAAGSVVAAFLPRTVLDSDGNCGETYCAGFAARSDPFEAAFAALMEAVQSRLTDIAGARDDLVPEVYRPAAKPVPALGVAKVGAEQKAQGAPTLITERDALCQAGAGDVFLFALDCDEIGISVVRAIATGLQSVATDAVIQISLPTVKRLAMEAG